MTHAQLRRASLRGRRWVTPGRFRPFKLAVRDRWIAQSPRRGYRVRRCGVPTRRRYLQWGQAQALEKPAVALGGSTWP